MPDEATTHDRMPRSQQWTQQAIVVAFSLVVSLPFCNKAFHIDDPLYLGIARQILVEPLRPYDGLINWQHEREPAWKVSISPPGYSYWLAAWLAAGVTSEWGLHLAGSFWVVVLGLATHAWARRLGDRPLAATLLVTSSPILLAGQNLMLDVPMLALAASAIAVYLRAAERDAIGLAAFAGVLAGLSVNFKYAGVVAIGVMGLDAIAWRRWRLLAAPAVAIMLLLLVQTTIAMQQGVPQLMFARQWITRVWPSDARDMVHRTCSALMYLGASSAWCLLLAGSLRRLRLALTVIAGSLVGTGLAVWDLRNHEPAADPAAFVQAGLFAWNGTVALLWLTYELIWSRRRQRSSPLADAPQAWIRGPAIRHGIMLGAWTVGFWYLGTLNGPFVAPRALLPCSLSLVLAVLALVPIRRLGAHVLRAAVLVTLAIGLLVGTSDYLWAGVYRDYASRLAQEFRPAGGTLYFLGHWGWQYYAESAGMVQLDPVHSQLSPGDVIVWPRNVDCPLSVPLLVVLRRCRQIDQQIVPATAWLPRTRCPEGLIFLHGDTDRGRIPWGWTTQDSPQEVFRILLNEQPATPSLAPKRTGEPRGVSPRIA